MLNSEGFITGDDEGKIRAWIIGFNSVPAQPDQLDIIEELTEHSEKSNMLSHRSQQSLHNYQTNSSQQFEHNGSYSRPSICSSHENSEQYISPKNEDVQKGIVFPKDSSDHSDVEKQTQKTRKEQMLKDVKSSFKKNSQNLIETQHYKSQFNNNKNNQILIQDSLDDRNYLAESEKNDENEDDNQDSDAERKNKSETLIRNQMMDLSPHGMHSDDQKRTNNINLDTQNEYLNTQENTASKNQDSSYYQGGYSNNSEHNLNSQEQFEKLIDQSNQLITNQSNVNDSPKDNFSSEKEKSPINLNQKNKPESFTLQQQNQIISMNNNGKETPPLTNNKIITLNLPPSLLKQIDYSNTFGQKPIIAQKNEQSDTELENESLPIQQTINFFNQKNNQEHTQLPPQVLVHQSNSQISQKSEDKNIFTQTVSRLINGENQQTQNNNDLPAHRRLLSNTTHQSEDTSFENLNIQPNQIDSVQKGKQRIIDRKDSNDIKDDYQIVSNDQSNFKPSGSSQSSSNQKNSSDEFNKQVINVSGKYNSFKLNNLPSVMSNNIDESDDSIVVSQVGQSIKNQQKNVITNSKHMIKDMKEPEHNFEQLTKMLNSQENKKNEKILTDLQKQLQNCTHHNNLLQKKVDELLNLNTILSNEKLAAEKQCEDLKFEISEIKKSCPSSKEEKENIRQMYQELTKKLAILDKTKQDFAKNQNLPYQKEAEEQKKLIKELKEQIFKDQKINEMLKQDLIKRADECKIYKELNQKQQQEIQKLKQQESTITIEFQRLKQSESILTKKVASNNEEISQLKISLQEKDNLILQLKEKEQISLRLAPSTINRVQENSQSSNFNTSPQTQKNGANDLLINQVITLRSENEKQKAKISDLEIQNFKLNKQLNIYLEYDSKRNNDSDVKNQSQQKELMIAIQKQEASKTNNDLGNHRKAQSYIEFKQQSQNKSINNNYGMTINLKANEYELNDLQYLKPERQTVENLQIQSNKNYYFETNNKKSPIYQNEASIQSKSNLSMDLGNIQANNHNYQINDKYNQRQTTISQNKYINQQNEISQQPFYTPNKSTSVNMLKNITNSSFSNSGLQNTNISNNSFNNNNYILNTSSLNNTSLTPRALGQTNQDSLTYFQTNTSTKFLQIPNKINQIQQQQYERQSLSPSPQKTVNPNISQNKINQQSNLSINSPQQNSSFFNTLSDNRISNPATPQRINIPIKNNYVQQQQYQQQQIISPQATTKIQMQNTNNYHQGTQLIYKKPIFDQSPQTRNYNIVKTQEDLQIQQNSSIPHYNDFKLSTGMNSFRNSDQDFNLHNQQNQQNIQRRRQEDQKKPKPRIFSNFSQTPPRGSLNTSLQQIHNNLNSNNLNVNNSYTAPFPIFDTYQHTNR